ncbi:MAG: hypothetical protein WCL10_13375 [Novosphingobium sp.]|uniref:hypothetical protein n=1 Tax=Novosphingobium sp. TaxID=1874826 RepID=UPI003019FA6A
MPSKPNRSSEHDIAFAAMKYLATTPTRSATTAEVKQHVPNFITLTVDDREASETRPNEEVWQQVVGNIVSHRNDSPDNFINRGLISYDAGVWFLTPSGETYLKKRNT